MTHSHTMLMLTIMEGPIMEGGSNSQREGDFYPRATASYGEREKKILLIYMLIKLLFRLCAQWVRAGETKRREQTGMHTCFHINKTKKLLNPICYSYTLLGMEGSQRSG